jgi:hypothetical protein
MVLDEIVLQFVQMHRTQSVVAVALVLHDGGQVFTEALALAAVAVVAVSVAHFLQPLDDGLHRVDALRDWLRHLHI